MTRRDARKLALDTVRKRAKKRTRLGKSMEEIILNNSPLAMRYAMKMLNTSYYATITITP